MRWTLLIAMLSISSAAAATTEAAQGPTWSQIAAWLGAALASMVGVWATRLEARIGRETKQRETDMAALESRLESHINRSDHRAADLLGKAAANTLALSELRLEVARSLQNHPTKSDFERGLDRIGAQVDAMRDKLETLIAGQRPQ